MSDRFEDLRTFVAVMSAGGINAASAELDIAKSAVSRRVSELEERLGVILIARSTRRFEPTRAGIEYLRRAKEILSSLEDLDAVAGSTLAWRRIIVSAPAAVLTHLIPGTLAGVVGELTETVLELTPVRTGEHDARKADISVQAEEVTGLVNRVLATTVRVTCASPAYFSSRGEPGTPDDIHDHVLIGVGEDAANWRFSGSRGVGAAITVAVPDVEAAAQAAVAGLGIVQLPDFVVAQRLAGGSLKAVLSGHRAAATKLIASCSAVADPVVRQVYEALTTART